MNFDAKESLERLRSASHRSLEEGAALAFRLQDDAFDAGRSALSTLRDMHDASWLCLHESLNLFERNAKSTRSVLERSLDSLKADWSAWAPKA